MFLENNNSLVVKTGQLWKLKLILGLIFVEFFIIVLMVWNINNPDSKFFTALGIGALQIQTIFLTLGLLILFSLFLLIKCPNCNKRPIYRIVSTSGVSNWIYEIFNFQKCPFCGYTGGQQKT
jgi:hypothetical protein